MQKEGAGKCEERCPENSSVKGMERNLSPTIVYGIFFAISIEFRSTLNHPSRHAPVKSPASSDRCAWERSTATDACAA